VSADRKKSDLLPVEQALSRILEALRPLPSEVVALSDALGRVTAAPIRARRTQPPAAMSAMDGYAVRGADVATVPATLTQVGTSAAGAGYRGTVGAGECVRIFTGAPLPEGADAIVIQEDTTVDGDQITMTEAVTAGTYVRAAGLDFKEGDEGVAGGRRLTSRDIGLAAAMNVPWVTVSRRPRVAILATGDEIVRPGEPIGPDQIVSSNGYGLAAFVRALGGEPIDLGIAPDDGAALRTMAAGARGADLLVTTGGASVGDHDLIQSALADEGLGPDALKVGFWRIAMRPGKPLIFGDLGGVPMLGLPGNPVSTLVCALVFLGPALERLMGLPPAPMKTETATLASDLPVNDQRQDYLRATSTVDAAGGRAVTPFSRQDSSMMSRLAQADCLIVRPPFDESRPAGSPVTILPLADPAPPI